MTQRNKPIVALDGPAGVGKSTAAKGAARELGYTLIDTGALYRATAWLAQKEDVDWEDDHGLAEMIRAHQFTFDSTGMLALDGESMDARIRTSEIGLGASHVAKHAAVRESLLHIQRVLGQNGGVVLEGRDIGTVVFPDAEVKFFLTASAEVRAQRRFLELQQRGEEISLAEVAADQRRRDEQDRNREIAPLRRAEDAIELVCDTLSPSEVVAVIATQVRKMEK